jgi:phosphatidylserine decarboxylase
MLARGSISWIATAALVALIGFLLSREFIGVLQKLFFGLFVLFFLLTLFFLVFFRDPDRIPKGNENDAVSPADGRVISIKDQKICIFMNIHNVHVNRAPLAGTVTHIDYKPGGFIPAFNKDSNVNERNHVVMNTENGTLELTQIAGILTRRIVSYVSEGSIVKRGERIGMIRFGSRVDVIIPPSYEFTVLVGNNVTAGETIIAKKKVRRE